MDRPCLAGSRATSYLRSPESAGANGKGILWVRSFPIYNPEARRGGSDLMVRWLSAQPGTVRDPAGLGLRPCPLAEADRRPRVRAKRRGCSRFPPALSWNPLPIRIPPPLATLLGLQRRSPPPTHLIQASRRTGSCEAEVGSPPTWETWPDPRLEET